LPPDVLRAGDDPTRPPHFVAERREVPDAAVGVPRRRRYPHAHLRRREFGHRDNGLLRLPRGRHRLLG
jgi:hypothetical protein